MPNQINKGKEIGMTVDTTIRTRVLSSMNLTKVIAPELYNTAIVKNNAVVNRYKVIYRATVLNNDEYKDIVGVGRTENDAFKKLNDSLFSVFMIYHSDEFLRIIDEIRKEKKGDVEEKEELIPKTPAA